MKITEKQIIEILEMNDLELFNFMISETNPLVIECAAHELWKRINKTESESNASF